MFAVLLGPRRGGVVLRRGARREATRRRSRPRRQAQGRAPSPRFPARVRIAGVPLGGLDAATGREGRAAGFRQAAARRGRREAPLRSTRASSSTAYVATARRARARRPSPGDERPARRRRSTAPPFARTSPKLAGQFDRKSVPAGSRCAPASRTSRPRARPPARRRRARVARHRPRAQLEHAPAGPRADEKTSSGLTESEIGSVHPDQPQPEPPHASSGSAVTHVPGRHRPIDLSDAQRPLRHRRQVDEPVVVSAGLDAWARASTPDPARPGNPLGTRWMGLSSPGVGIHGTPTRASSATACRTAASGCRCRTPSGSSTTSTSARRSLSSSACAASPRLSQSRLSLGCSGLLVWDLAHTSGGKIAKERATRARSPAYPFTQSRIDTDGTLARVAGWQGDRDELLAVVLPAVHTTRRGRSSAAPSTGTVRRSCSSASTCRTCAARRAHS